MRVSVQGDNDELLWRRDHDGGFIAASYLEDGTRQKIIDAIAEARGQLGRLPLNVVDAVANVGVTTTKVNRDVPIVGARHGDPSR